MRRLILALFLAVSLLTTVAGSALAQPAPQFQMGFATLASLIPDIVGQPIAHEQFDSQSGQSVQPTTRGLMVWRKVDNATAFTNGSTTWILGPGGLQQRPNDTIFAWERPMVVEVAPVGDPSPEVTVDTAIQQLAAVPAGADLVNAATQNGVLIEMGRLPRTALGAFIPEENLVIVSSQLASAPSKAPANVLAHELQHAEDVATMGEPQTPAQCFNFEERAFFKQATVWEQLWGGNLPPNSNPFYAEFNDIAVTVATNPNAFVAQLVQRYQSECGPLQQ